LNIIESDRLIIRAWKAEDYLNLFELSSDEKVNPNAGCSVIKDIERIKSSLEVLIQNNQSFAVVLKEENKVIGTIGMDEISPDELLKDLKQRYIGFRFNSKYWGKGYATETTQQFIKFLFEYLDLDLIWTSHYDFNIRSRRVIEKSGFQYKFAHNTIVKALGNKPVTELFYNITRR
jgi:RimJ/RimL family protein N-acetyltransferase